MKQENQDSGNQRVVLVTVGAEKSRKRESKSRIDYRSSRKIKVAGIKEAF
ncbi:hypothetical protein [Neobacillus niacini]|nr:hypothetical protein [Neobacillus niacini]